MSILFPACGLIYKLPTKKSPLFDIRICIILYNNVNVYDLMSENDKHQNFISFFVDLLLKNL